MLSLKYKNRITFLVEQKRVWTTKRQEPRFVEINRHIARNMRASVASLRLISTVRCRYRTTLKRRNAGLIGAMRKPNWRKGRRPDSRKERELIRGRHMIRAARIQGPNAKGRLVAAQSKNRLAAVSGVGTSLHNLLYGSPSWARTSDLRINSPSLYRLSYRGPAVKKREYSTYFFECASLSAIFFDKSKNFFRSHGVLISYCAVFFEFAQSLRKHIPLEGAKEQGSGEAIEEWRNHAQRMGRCLSFRLLKIQAVGPSSVHLS
jgi:hypothetical protein